MPVKENKEKSSIPEKSEGVEITLDFAELALQKELLFKEIEQKSLKFDSDQKSKIVDQILGYSIKDGFEIAKRLGLRGSSFMLELGGIVSVKNKKFVRAFIDFMKENHRFVEDLKNVDFVDFDIEMLERCLLEQENVVSPQDWEKLQDYPFFNEINNHYKEFIRNRRVTSPEAPEDERTQVERTAEEHLESARVVLMGSYYTGPVRKFLGVEDEAHLTNWLSSKQMDLNNHATSEDQAWALRRNLIDSETLHGLLWDSGYRREEIEEIFDHKLNQARYAPNQLLFEQRKKGAEEGLVTQIKESLKKRGFQEGEFEIKFDEEKGEYEVINKREINFKRMPDDLSADWTDPVSKNQETINLNFEQSLARWQTFYETQKVALPPDFEKISRAIWDQNYDKIKEAMESLGYDGILIIPGGLNLPDFHQKMTEGYNPTWESSNFKEGGWNGITTPNSDKTRIILIHEKNARNNAEHPIIKELRGKSVETLSKIPLAQVQEMLDKGEEVPLEIEVAGKSFKFKGLDVPGYLAWQREFFNRNKNYIDEKGWSSLPGSSIKSLSAGRRVPKLDCHPASGRLCASAVSPGHVADFLAVRPVAVFNLVSEVSPDLDFDFSIQDLQSRKQILATERLKLTEREQKDLDLANAVAKEDLPAIEGYFGKYYPRDLEQNLLPDDRGVAGKIRRDLRNTVEQSKSFIRAVNQTIKEAPEMFLDTLRAKNDKPTEALMTEMFYYMFPEAKSGRERALQEKRARYNPWNIFGGGGGRRGSGDESFDYDAGVDHFASVDEKGYYEMIKAKREVLRLRETLSSSTFIAHGIFGNYQNGGWTKVNVPISDEIREPAKETTFEFVDEKSSKNINLPKITNAKIITERLRGLTDDGKEIPVEILEENNLGEVRVDKGKKAKHLLYSQSYSESPKTMSEIPAGDYEKFRRSFEKSFGDVMTKPIGDLGDELNIFIAGLKDKTPREQVIAIQEFCYEYGYYSLGEEMRDTDNFEERLSIMELRLDELKAKKPELAGKKYAGICTDFATLSAALLRKAGFVSGIMSGFVPEAGSLSIKTDRAHAVSYVLWPNPENREGKPDLIIVDGTPASITPKIIEQEKRAEVFAKQLSVDAEKELSELEQVLKTMDVEAIRKLENGHLEKTLNHILYGVKESHVNVIDRVLNASRYAGFDIVKMAGGNLEDEIAFRKFLEDEIYKEKGLAHKNRERQGEKLFDLVREFTQRFEKDKTVDGKTEALDVLEKIFDTADKYLDPIEKRSVVAIITYLRARKMR